MRGRKARKKSMSTTSCTTPTVTWGGREKGRERERKGGRGECV